MTAPPPDRIWAWPVADDWNCLCGSWDGIEDTMPPPQQAYIAATPEALAASPEVQAITARAVRLALERAASQCDAIDTACGMEAGLAASCADTIRAMATDEAVAAIIKEASE